MLKELCQVQLPVLYLVYFMMQFIAKIKTEFTERTTSQQTNGNNAEGSSRRVTSVATAAFIFSDQPTPHKKK